MRIVGQAFPADRGAWFFHVGAHDQEHFIADVVGEAGEVAGVFEGRLRIVDRAGTDDDQQAGVFTVEDGAHGVAVGGDLAGEVIAQGQLLFELQ
ncbi:hypothetical protein D3C73_1554370 [compost metagenome]